MLEFFPVLYSTYSSSSLTYSSLSLALEPGIGWARTTDLRCGQVLYKERLVLGIPYV